MKINLFLRACAFLVLTTTANHSFAEIYKCTRSDKETGQTHIVYSDSPCRITLSTSQSVSQDRLKVVDSEFATSSDRVDLDLLVSRAVLNREFGLAKSLATTKEHWRLISMAEGTHQPTVKTAPIGTARNVRDECAVARDDFESTSRTRWRDDKLIATKKSIMFAACGVSEPTQEGSVVVAYPYRRIQPSRWVATAPYGQAGYYPHHQRYNKQYSTQKTSGGSLSLSYQSKHLGLRAQSVGSQSHADIRQQFRTKNFAAKKQVDIRQQFR